MYTHLRTSTHPILLEHLLSELDSQLNLEEEILAAVESVLESFEEDHHN